MTPPLVCTLNAARVLAAAARLLGVDHARLSELALAGPPGADGLVLVPWLEGERNTRRTRRHRHARGTLAGHLHAGPLGAGSVEGMLCGLADGLDALARHGAAPRRLLLVGGGAASPVVREIAPTALGLPVDALEPGEYVADGAARQAAWVLEGSAEQPG